MEHILQFGVTIDEQAIVDHVKERASREIIKKVEKEIDKYTHGWQDTKLDNLFREEIKKVLNANKDEIIDKSVTRLASNMAKTKAVKDMIKKMEEGDV